MYIYIYYHTILSFYVTNSFICVAKDIIIKNLTNISRHKNQIFELEIWNLALCFFLFDLLLIIIYDRVNTHFNTSPPASKRFL